jgi:hypothetical protein
MTYRGIVRNGVVVIEGERPAEGTLVDVRPRGPMAGEANALEIGPRLDELRALKDGWLDGLGKALPPQGLDWLAGVLKRHYPGGLMPPHFYPTTEGGVQAEWTLRPWEILLEIDLATRVGQWHALNLQSGDEVSRELNLEQDTSWE